MKPTTSPSVGRVPSPGVSPSRKHRGRHASGRIAFCHATGCVVHVPKGTIFCYAHWKKLPAASRTALKSALRFQDSTPPAFQIALKNALMVCIDDLEIQAAAIPE